VIRRLISLVLIVWALGFVGFAATLPQPEPGSQNDAIVVPTGSGGRIERGLAMLEQGFAREMLVSGVDPLVKPREFTAEYNVPDRLMDCCITLGFSALDTRGNARETAQWMEARRFTSLRLVTADWHMRRAALELASQLPDGTTITRDAVRSNVSLWTLFLEYHKFMAAWLLQALA
jgi:uncharacterized SAM-binding protein YcdF (DUF218 family)